MELVYIFIGIVVGYFLSEGLHSKRRVHQIDELDVKFKEYVDSAEEYQRALIKMYESIINGYIVEVEPIETKSVERELKESTKKDGQWYGSVFISDEEMEESARNVMRRMRGEW